MRDKRCGQVTGSLPPGSSLYFYMIVELGSNDYAKPTHFPTSLLFLFLLTTSLEEWFSSMVPDHLPIR